jgi:hypothetical protein
LSTPDQFDVGRCATARTLANVVLVPDTTGRQEGAMNPHSV